MNYWEIKVYGGGMSYTDDIRTKFNIEYKLVQKLIDSTRWWFRNTERYSHVAGTPYFEFVMSQVHNSPDESSSVTPG